ncbi:MAG: hypothetical protein QM692_02925 [Thermomicrobiales bacterium]
MDGTQFDHIARDLGARATRRTAVALLAGLGAGAAGAVSARGKKKRKKVTLCLQGLTVTVPKKRQRTFLRLGATSGACPPAPDPCNCDPCLREACVNGACQCPGGMIRDANGVCGTMPGNGGCQPIGATTQPGRCCSGTSNPASLGNVFCIPGAATCQVDNDCLRSQHCVGFLCAPRYIDAVGEACSARAFDICSQRSQCPSGRCDDNLCKTCTSNQQCGVDPVTSATCLCRSDICVRPNSTNTTVSNCSACPANTDLCFQVASGPATYVCLKRCGAPS